MGTNEDGRATDDVMMTLHVIGCFSVLTLLALTEQFGALPAALAASAAASYVLRL